MLHFTPIIKSGFQFLVWQYDSYFYFISTELKSSFSLIFSFKYFSNYNFLNISFQKSSFIISIGIWIFSWPLGNIINCVYNNIREIPLLDPGNYVMEWRGQTGSGNSPGSRGARWKDGEAGSTEGGDACWAKCICMRVCLISRMFVNIYVTLILSLELHMILLKTNSWNRSIEDSPYSCVANSVHLHWLYEN